MNENEILKDKLCNDLEKPNNFLNKNLNSLSKTQ